MDSSDQESSNQVSPETLTSVIIESTTLQSDDSATPIIPAPLLPQSSKIDDLLHSIYISLRTISDLYQTFASDPTIPNIREIEEDFVMIDFGILPSNVGQKSLMSSVLEFCCFRFSTPVAHWKRYFPQELSSSLIHRNLSTLNQLLFSVLDSAFQCLAPSSLGTVQQLEFHCHLLNHRQNILQSFAKFRKESLIILQNLGIPFEPSLYNTTLFIADVFSDNSRFLFYLGHLIFSMSPEEKNSPLMSQRLFDLISHSLKSVKDFSSAEFESLAENSSPSATITVSSSIFDVYQVIVDTLTLDDLSILKQNTNTFLQHFSTTNKLHQLTKSSTRNMSSTPLLKQVVDITSSLGDISVVELETDSDSDIETLQHHGSVSEHETKAGDSDSEQTLDTSTQRLTLVQVPTLESGPPTSSSDSKFQNLHLASDVMSQITPTNLQKLINDITTDTGPIDSLLSQFIFPELIIPEFDVSELSFLSATSISIQNSAQHTSQSVLSSSTSVENDHLTEIIPKPTEETDGTHSIQLLTGFDSLISLKSDPDSQFFVLSFTNNSKPNLLQQAKAFMPIEVRTHFVVNHSNILSFNSWSPTANSLLYRVPKQFSLLSNHLFGNFENHLKTHNTFVNYSTTISNITQRCHIVRQVVGAIYFLLQLGLTPFDFSSNSIILTPSEPNQGFENQNWTNMCPILTRYASSKFCEYLALLKVDFSPPSRWSPPEEFVLYEKQISKLSRKPISRTDTSNPNPVDESSSSIADDLLTHQAISSSSFHSSFQDATREIVFRFGLFLQEIFTGIPTRFYVNSWARLYKAYGLPHVIHTFESPLANPLVNLIRLCTSHVPENRPSIDALMVSYVPTVLSGLLSLPNNQITVKIASLNTGLHKGFLEKQLFLTSLDLLPPVSHSIFSGSSFVTQKSKQCSDDLENPISGPSSILTASSIGPPSASSASAWKNFKKKVSQISRYIGGSSSSDDDDDDDEKISFKKKLSKFIGGDSSSDDDNVSNITAPTRSSSSFFLVEPRSNPLKKFEQGDKDFQELHSEVSSSSLETIQLSTDAQYSNVDSQATLEGQSLKLTSTKDITLLQRSSTHAASSEMISQVQDESSASQEPQLKRSSVFVFKGSDDDDIQIGNLHEGTFPLNSSTSVKTNSTQLTNTASLNFSKKNTQSPQELFEKGLELFKQDRVDGNHEAFRLFMKAALENHVKSMVAVCHFLSMGYGVVRVDNPSIFKAWLRRAAIADDSAAQAWCLRRGYTLQKVIHRKDVLHQLEHLANTNQANTFEYDVLGELYADNRFLHRDFAKAIKYFSKSSELGNGSAQSSLGFMYAQGQGGAKDIPRAIDLWKKSARQSNCDGINNLAGCYFKGTGLDSNPEFAVSLWKVAAIDIGDPRAQVNYGLCLQHGTGCPEDESKAVKLFRAAYEQGDSQGAYLLGMCYYEGIGMDIDRGKAAKLFRYAQEDSELREKQVLRNIVKNKN